MRGLGATWRFHCWSRNLRIRAMPNSGSLSSLVKPLRRSVGTADGPPVRVGDGIRRCGPCVVRPFNRGGGGSFIGFLD